MNVLHVITGLNDGGAEAALFRLCTNGTCVNHRVISLMDGGKYGPLLTSAGIPVVTIGMLRGQATFAGICNLWRALRAGKPDVVQTWMYHGDFLGGIVARLAGFRGVVWGIRHSVLIRGDSSRTTIWLAKISAKLSSIIPKRIVCCAEKAREAHVALGYDAGRMVVIPNGYDLSVFQPQPDGGLRIRRELGLSEDQAVIGFVARFDPLKDHYTLLRAVRRLAERENPPVCLLVGTGMDDENRQLATMIEQLDIASQVRLLGRRDDIPAIMSALDLHVMSSTSEAFPNVLAEAMACATPCVTTDVGDAAQIVGDTGWVVPASDPDALATAIDEALSERSRRPDAWKARGALARQRIVEEFSIDRMVEAYRSVWKSVLDSAKKA